MVIKKENRFLLTVYVSRCVRFMQSGDRKKYPSVCLIILILLGIRLVTYGYPKWDMNI